METSVITKTFSDLSALLISFSSLIIATTFASVLNCSYPKNISWKKMTFNRKNYDSFSENISLHLNNYCYISKIVAEKMKKDKVKGSIINFSSIYGIVAQDLNIYSGTKMTENIAYGSIKAGIINFTKLI